MTLDAQAQTICPEGCDRTNGSAISESAVQLSEVQPPAQLSTEAKLRLAEKAKADAEEQLIFLKERLAAEQEAEQWKTYLPVTCQLMTFATHYLPKNRLLNGKWCSRYVPGSDQHRSTATDLDHFIRLLVQTGKLKDGNAIYADAHALVTDLHAAGVTFGDKTSQTLWDWELKDPSLPHFILKLLDWNGRDWQKPIAPFPISRVLNLCSPSGKQGFVHRFASDIIELVKGSPNSGFLSDDIVRQRTEEMMFSDFTDGQLMREVKRRKLVPAVLPDPVTLADIAQGIQSKCDALVSCLTPPSVNH